MKKIILFLILVVLAPVLVKAQGAMVVHYTFTNYQYYSADGTTHYSSYNESGYTTCPNGQCPNNAHHSGSITNSLGTTGGTQSGIDSVPAQNQLYAAYNISQTGVPVTWELETIGGEIVCTVVGPISSDPSPKKRYVEDAVDMFQTASKNSACFGTAECNPYVSWCLGLPDWQPSPDSTTLGSTNFGWVAAEKGLAKMICDVTNDPCPAGYVTRDTTVPIATGIAPQTYNANTKWGCTKLGVTTGQPPWPL
jgi:hypothetical protein